MPVAAACNGVIDADFFLKSIIKEPIHISIILKLESSPNFPEGHSQDSPVKEESRSYLHVMTV